MRRRAMAVTAVVACLALTAGPAVAANNPDPWVFNNNAQSTPSAAATTAPAAGNAANATPAETDPVSRDLALARGNRSSRDLVGWQPSLYQGKWFVAEIEPIRKCIMDRESNFSYTAVGAGTYFGAYQMNRGLANGATVTMEDEVRKEMGPEGVAILKALRDIPPNRWNRYWQDRAFYTVWHGGDGKGNWRGGGLNCF
jgi:hypothetical protein